MIVDASVVFKWIVTETDSAAARALLTVHRQFSAPSSLLAEIGHALTKHVRRDSISQAAAQDIWSDLRAAPIQYRRSSSVADAALSLSLSLHANFYDCLYLALAIAEDDVLVTADARFAEAVRARPALSPRVQMLGD